MYFAAKSTTTTTRKSVFNLTLYSIDTHFDKSTAFENIVGIEEIAQDEQFLLFPQCFLLNLIPVIISPFVHIFDITALFAAELEKPKIGISGKGLINVATNLLLPKCLILHTYTKTQTNVDYPCA